MNVFHSVEEEEEMVVDSKIERAEELNGQLTAVFNNGNDHSQDPHLRRSELITLTYLSTNMHSYNLAVQLY